MAYDEELAEMLRNQLDGEVGVTQRKMFGGLGFMVDGHIAVAASSSGDLLVRVDPKASEEWVDGEVVRLMEMRGRQMRGWLLVPVDCLVDHAALATWIGRGLSYARSLPPKSA